MKGTWALEEDLALLIEAKTLEGLEERISKNFIPQYQIHLRETVSPLKMHCRGTVPLFEVFFKGILKLV